MGRLYSGIHPGSQQGKKTLESENLLASLFATHIGKYSDKWSSYLDVYWNLFAPIRQSEIDVLEIGIQNGGSLEIWAEFFPNAKTLIGFDNDPKCKDLEFEDPRIKVFVDDAGTEQAGTTVKQTSSNLGVVIDDGSHISKDIIRSFLIFFPQLKPGGLYVIEDLHASYWHDWQGGISHPDSSIQFLKLLADVVNFDHWGISSMRTELFDMIPSTSGLLSENTFAEIESVLFLDSVCVIRKKTQNYIGLGRRVGSGSEAKVFDGVKQSIGRISSPPPQQGNQFANIRDLSLTQALTYKTQNQQLTEQNQQLTEQNQQLTEQNQQLTEQNDFNKQSIRAMTATWSWRVTKPLRYIRNFSSNLKKVLK
jgi:hypothetical protein